MTALSIDTPRMTDFLLDLLRIPSPTGYHAEAMTFIESALVSLDLPGLTLSRTYKGALLATWPGLRSDAPRAVTAHTDTLGLMVKAIKPSGALQATNLGGIMWPGIEYENVTVRTHDDRRIRGTVILSNPSAHVNPKARTTERNADTMEIRLDAPVSSAADVRALGIAVGDFIFLDPRPEVTDTGFIKSRFLDDKSGVAVVYGALAAMGAAGLRPAQDTHILIANYEEVGHGGSAGLPDDLAELLVIDMAAMGDGQTSTEDAVTICIKDSGGPYHFDMNQRLRHLADAHQIAYHTDIYPSYNSDGTAYWRAGGGARVGLIGPGVASSHGYERTHQDGLLHSAHLIARYLLDDGR